MREPWASVCKLRQSKIGEKSTATYGRQRKGQKAEITYSTIAVAKAHPPYRIRKRLQINCKKGPADTKRRP